jgi:HSP20 family protein
MANLARYDPYSSIARSDPFDLLDRVGSLFEPLLRGTASGQWPMHIELLERENAYELIAEVPGLRKEDIDVTVAGNEVTVGVDVKEEKEAGGETGVRRLFSERWHGRTSRTIRLPLEIDQDGAEASCSDGLLRLTLPKKSSSMAKRVAVH